MLDNTKNCPILIEFVSRSAESSKWEWSQYLTLYLRDLRCHLSNPRAIDIANWISWKPDLAQASWPIVLMSQPVLMVFLIFLVIHMI